MADTTYYLIHRAAGNMVSKLLPHENPAFMRRTMTITNGVKAVHLDKRVIGQLHPYGEHPENGRVRLRDNSRRRSSIPKDIMKNVEVVEL